MGGDRVGAGISIAVMFTKDADVFLRAGLLLLLGVVFWVVNLAVLRRQGARTPRTS